MIAIDSINDDIKTCSNQEPQPEDSKTSRKRRVSFDCDNNVVHETEESMSSEEFQSYYMQRRDYERCDKDINESVKKWMLSQAGRIVFDEERFSARGVEALLDHMKCMHCPKKQSRLQQTTLQIRAVLKSYKANPVDVEHTRMISQRFSAVAVDLAVRTAERDAAVVLRTPQPPNPSSSRSKHAGLEFAPMHKDKKARLGRRFSFLRRASSKE